MDDFDRFLEQKLREMLALVVTASPPVRVEWHRPPQNSGSAVVDLAATTIPLDAATVTVPVTSAPQL